MDRMIILEYRGIRIVGQGCPLRYLVDGIGHPGRFNRLLDATRAIDERIAGEHRQAERLFGLFRRMRKVRAK